MRLAVSLAIILTTMPVSAACRLSPGDCRALYREMAVEADASADDERHYHPAGLTRYERATALAQRHFERVDERSFVLPRAIGDEWSRLEACAGSSVATDPSCQ